MSGLLEFSVPEKAHSNLWLFNFLDGRAVAMIEHFIADKWRVSLFVDHTLACEEFARASSSGEAIQRAQEMASAIVHRDSLTYQQITGNPVPRAFNFLTL